MGNREPSLSESWASVKSSRAESGRSGDSSFWSWLDSHPWAWVRSSGINVGLRQAFLHEGTVGDACPSWATSYFTISSWIFAQPHSQTEVNKERAILSFASIWSLPHKPGAGKPVWQEAERDFFFSFFFFLIFSEAKKNECHHIVTHFFTWVGSIMLPTRRKWLSRAAIMLLFSFVLFSISFFFFLFFQNKKRLLLLRSSRTVVSFQFIQRQHAPCSLLFFLHLLLLIFTEKQTRKNNKTSTSLRKGKNLQSSLEVPLWFRTLALQVLSNSEGKAWRFALLFYV